MIVQHSHPIQERWSSSNVGPKKRLKKGPMGNEVAFNCVRMPIFSLFTADLCDVCHRQKRSPTRETTHTRKTFLFVSTVRRWRRTLVRHALLPPQNKALVFLGRRRFVNDYPDISIGLDGA